MRGARPLLLAAGILGGMAGAQEASFRLATGLKVEVHSAHQRPFLHAFLRVDLPEDLGEGDRQFLQELLTGAGGDALDRKAHQRALADRALLIDLLDRPGSWTWVVSGESPEQDGALEALARAAARPNLGEAWMAAQGAGLSQPAGREAFLGRLGLPGGVRPLPSGSSLARALALHRLLVRPERSTLRIQGDVSLAQAHELVRRHFGAWAPGAPDPLPGEAPRPDTARVLVAPGEGGPALWVGVAPPRGPWDPLATLVLERRLRGLLEGQGGALVQRRGLAPGTAPLQAAQAFLAELDRRLAAPLTGAELADAREALGRAQVLASLHPGLPAPEPSADAPAALQARLTPEAVRGRLVLLLEGLGRESQAGLEALGLGSPVFFSR